MTIDGKLAWSAGLPDGTGVLMLRASRIAAGDAAPVNLEDAIMVTLSVPSPLIATADGFEIDANVRVTTEAAVPTARHQTFAPRAWALAGIARSAP